MVKHRQRGKHVTGAIDYSQSMMVGNVNIELEAYRLWAEYSDATRYQEMRTSYCALQELLLAHNEVQILQQLICHQRSHFSALHQAKRFQEIWWRVRNVEGRLRWEIKRRAQ